MNPDDKIAKTVKPSPFLCIHPTPGQVTSNNHYTMLCIRLVPREFNSYGSRRGNDAVMARGTFANIRLLNKFMGKAMPKTKHFPSEDTVSSH